jgi:hypothetical protein
MEEGHAAGGSIGGQWRAMRDGNAGTYGTYGNVVSASYRI